MRRQLGLRSLALVGVLQSLQAAPVFSQPLPVPPPPPVATGALADCVPRFGHTGCAARLYAQLLCTAVGSSTPASELQLQLDQQYEQAAIDFRGITAAQIEKAAVGYYVPMLCPDKRIEIRELFAPLENAPQS